MQAETLKKKKYNFSCVVNGCRSRANDDPRLKFHSFSKANTTMIKVANLFGKVEKKDRLKAWMQAVNISNEKFIKSQMKICSLHFAPSDYHFSDYQELKQVLKKDAVPSLNLPGKSSIHKKSYEVSAARLDRRQKRAAKQDSVISISLKLLVDVLKDQSNELAENISDNCTRCILEENEQQELNENFISTLKKDVETQTDELIIDLHNCNKTSDVLKDQHINNEVMNDSEFSDNINKSGEFDMKISIKTDADLSTLTGIQSFDILDFIVELLIVKYSDKFNNLRYKLPLKTRTIMTYMKLKHNMSYRLLSVLFGCVSESQCQRVFKKMIVILSECLKHAIEWPTREENSRNLPKCFKDYENVRVILDCTEIPIQSSKNLCCRLYTYSHYKHTFTCKVMTGVSPAGNITYIGKFYGGRASDKSIFEQSDIIQKLDPGDVIMVDKGFLIDDICTANRIKIIRPPFLSSKRNQFSKEESVEGAKIAAARVHIERSNQRIKNFLIMGSKMPVSLVPFIDFIFTVICGTINLGSPILSASKFMNN